MSGVERDGLSLRRFFYDPNNNGSWKEIMIKIIRLAILVIVFWTIQTAELNAIDYYATNLGVFFDGQSQAYGLNDQGQVVGSGVDSSYSARHAFLYDKGEMHSLGSLGGNSDAWTLNANGSVVGRSWTCGPNHHAFLYSDGVMQDLGTFGGNSSNAYGINDSDEVVGYAYTTDNKEIRAFYYTNGVMQDIGTLGGSHSYAYDINNNNQIVGNSSISGDSERHAFMYSGGVMQDLGTLGGTDSKAWGININAQVVGYSDIDGDTAEHAFYYDNGELQDLGTLGGINSWAWDINNIGQIVGGSRTVGDTEIHAFLYSSGVMVDLNSLMPLDFNYTLRYAYAINESGQIASVAVDQGGNSYAFLLNPIPEPCTLALLTIGGVAVVWRKR